MAPRIHVLDHGENVAGGQAAAPLHAQAAQIDDQQRRRVQHKGGQRVDDGHVDVGADDVVRHDPGGLGDAPVGLPLPVEGADHADAPQPLPDQIVLLVAVVVGDLPEMVDLFAHEEHNGNQQRHGADDHQREPEILAHTEEYAPQKHQGNDDDIAAEHGHHPIQRAHVMGGAGHQIGGADAPHLGQGHGVDLAEQGGAEAPGVAGNDLIDHPIASRHRGQAQHGNAQHPAGGFQNIAEGIPLGGAVDALVQHVGHQRRQQQIADRRNSHQQRGHGDSAPIGLQIG